MTAPRKLPEFEVLHDLYVKQGMSLQQIADRFDYRDREGVRKALQRGARRAGLPWPLPGVRESRPERMSRHHGSVPAIGLRMEVTEAVEKFGVTKRELCEQAGVSYDVIVKVTNGHVDRVTPDLVAKVIAVIERLERAERRRATARAGLMARRAKLAREKAAGQRPLSQRDIREGRRYVA